MRFGAGNRDGHISRTCVGDVLTHQQDDAWFWWRSQRGGREFEPRAVHQSPHTKEPSPGGCFRVRSWRSAMTADGFRRLALGLPEASEASHMDHADFRVRGKIFATLGHPAAGWGMVKLPLAQQTLFALADPDVFVPVAGGWGRRGATSV